VLPFGRRAAPVRSAALEKPCGVTRIKLPEAAVVTMGFGSNPTSYESRFVNVRTNRRAPTSDTSASDTCTMTSALRSLDRRTLVPRAPSFSVSTRLPRDVCIAGRNPNKTAVTTATVTA